MNYYYAKNRYRSSTDHGFANTWVAHEAATKAEQLDVLRNGLPVRDAEYIDNDGKRQPVVTTMGIRPLTRSERRQVERLREVQPHGPWNLS